MSWAEIVMVVMEEIVMGFLLLLRDGEGRKEWKWNGKDSIAMNRIVTRLTGENGLIEECGGANPIERKVSEKEKIFVKCKAGGSEEYY